MAEGGRYATSGTPQKSQSGVEGEGAWSLDEHARYSLPHGEQEKEPDEINEGSFKEETIIKDSKAIPKIQSHWCIPHQEVLQQGQNLRWRAQACGCFVVERRQKVSQLASRGA